MWFSVWRLKFNKFISINHNQTDFVIQIVLWSKLPTQFHQNRRSRELNHENVYKALKVSWYNYKFFNNYLISSLLSWIVKVNGSFQISKLHWNFIRLNHSILLIEDDYSSRKYERLLSDENLDKECQKMILKLNE